MLLLNLIFLCFMYTSVVIGPRQKNPKHKETSTELNTVTKLNMGFLDEFGMRKLKPRENSVTYTKKHIRHIYKQLECSYALFAMRYMLVIEVILADPTDLVKGDLENVLFDNEAAAMLAASIHTASLNGVTNTMWAFWLYADRLHRFLDSTEKSGKVHNQNHSTVLAVHRAVDAVLDRFLKSYECTFHDIGGKLKELTEQILEITTANNADKLERLVGLVVSDKKVFDQQKFANSNLGILTDGQQQISMRTLNLNGLLGAQTIVASTVGTEFWGTIEDRLRHVYNTAMAFGVTLSNQVRSLISFQKDFTDTLKLVALHFGRHFLLATANAGHSVTNLETREINFYAQLTTLDRLIKNVIWEPRDWDTIDLIVNYIHRRTASVEEIENTITSILSQSTIITPIDLSKFSINNNRNNNAKVPDELHASVVEQTELFVKITNEVWSDVNFAIVKSFVAFASSEECQYVAEF